MLTPAAYRTAFEAALPYPAYIETAKPHERTNWQSFDKRVSLSTPQQEVIHAFARRINILVISGSWCGDCVQQVPILAAIAATLPAGNLGGREPGIDLRIIDRDQPGHTDFTERFTIASGRRVPIAIFLNEDFDFCALAGDRTLARYRRIAAAQLGPSCPLPGAPVPTDEVAAVTTEWVDQFERIALMLRLSAKLRQRHGD